MAENHMMARKPPVTSQTHQSIFDRNTVFILNEINPFECETKYHPQSADNMN